MLDVTAGGDAYRKYVPAHTGTIEFDAPMFEGSISWTGLTGSNVSIRLNDALFTAYVHSVSTHTGSLEHAPYQSVLLKINGSRSFATLKEENPMKKFLVDSRAFETEKEAIEHATIKINTGCVGGNELVIFKAIKIVRRKQQPVVVEKIK